MEFRSRLLATLRAMQPVLEVPGVLVVGSEVPNLLENDAAATLVVSQDVDIGVAVHAHDRVKQRLNEVQGLQASEHEPSVWLPTDETMIEVNFVGIDRDIHHPDQTYVFEDDVLPLLVFGQLSWMRPGPSLRLEGLTIPLPRTAGLLLEKLVTDRTGVKGDRDLLVVAGMLPLCTEADLRELEIHFRGLSEDLRHAVCSNLTLLSLLEPVAGMPDPESQRERVAKLLGRLEANQEGGG